MDTLKLHLLPAGEAYKKLEKLIWRTVHTFIRRYDINQNEFDDLVGEAEIGFTKAYNGFNASLAKKGKQFHFGGYVQRCVWRRFCRPSTILFVPSACPSALSSFAGWKA